MKKAFVIAGLMLLAAGTVLFISGCLKDTAVKTYKLYIPVIQTMAEVRAAIKSDAPQPVVNAGKMYVSGNYIFLNEKEKGIHIIDNSNPSSPVNTAFIHIPGNEDLAVKGNILYADCYTDLMAIDIGDAKNVSLKSYLNNIFPDRRTVNGYTADSGKIVTDWIIKDTVVSGDAAKEYTWAGQGLAFFASSSASYASVSPIGVGGSMARFAIQNNYLYTVTTSNLNIVNLSNPSAPQVSATKNIGWNIETIYPFQDKLFIGSQTGMQVFSISNPKSPEYISIFSHARVCDPVITDGKYAYITLHSGSNRCAGIENELDVVNVQNITYPVLTKKYLLTRPKGLSKDGNILIVCDDGLKIYDAASPDNLLLKQTLPLPGAYDVICLNGIALVSAKDGLYEFDYSNPSNVKQLSKISLNQ